MLKARRKRREIIRTTEAEALSNILEEAELCYMTLKEYIIMSRYLARSVPKPVFFELWRFNGGQ